MNEESKNNVVISKSLDSLGRDEVYCDWYRCPNCKNETTNDEFVYCHNCGIKIKLVD